MGDYILMPGTSDRHNNITGAFVGEIYPLRKSKQVHVLSENCLLVYWGKKSESIVELVDVTKITDVKRFVDSQIGDLGCVEPDFMLFKENPYIKNKNQTRTAGLPDLIIEIWSEGNKNEHKDFKKYLYSTSALTEHWYIEQDSNEIECYVGKERLPNQYLTNVLRTRHGIEFDLRYLAI